MTCSLVLVSPKGLVEVTGNTYVEDGEELRLKCSSEGAGPANSLQWFFDGNEVMQNDVYSIETTTISLASIESFLVISSVDTSSQLGSYMCSVTNGAGTGQDTVIVTGKAKYHFCWCWEFI